MSNDLKNSSLTFFVNGVKIVDRNVDPETTLLRYLRERLKLPGTKLGCGEGGCGACTVMVSKLNPDDGNIEHISVNACLCPVVCLHGMAVVTVEGIGSTRTRLHPVQERIAKSHGSQCGFCTPGFVMSMYALLRTDPNPSLQHIEENLVGNLCRCTGYRPIIEGFKAFSTRGASAGCGIENCCMLNGRKTPPITENKEKITMENRINDTDEKKHFPVDSNAEVIFPPELQVYSQDYENDLAIIGPRVSYFRPTTLKNLLLLKRNFPMSKLVCGNTEIGVEVKVKREPYPVLINPTFVTELTRITKQEKYVEVGACATLSKIEAAFNEFIKQSQEHEVRTLAAIVEMLQWFAGKQIRNVATIGGNLMTSSPISDLIPILIAAKAEVILKNKDSSRSIIISQNFFTGYRKNIVQPDEVMISIRIPYNKKNEFFYAFKQSKRKDDDIAIVNAAMSVEFHPSVSIVRSSILCFGGMGPNAIVAAQTAIDIQGKEWNEKLLKLGISSVLNELKLDPSVVGGMAEYRQTLTASLFYKYFLMVKKDLGKMYPNLIDTLTQEEESAIKLDSYCEPQSWQVYDKTEAKNHMDPIGKPIVHMSAFKQASGEAIYIDDMPILSDELYAGFVVSKKAKAKIVSIDASQALAIDGVRAFFSAKDIPAYRNQMGIMKEDKVFASGDVTCVGQVIGVVIADNQQLAQTGAVAVKVVYEESENAIISIEDAIEKGSLFGPWKIEKGDVESGFQKSSHLLEGEVRMGGQEHFYMETCANLIVPNSEDELDMFCATQNHSMMQSDVAFTLGIPQSKINCRVKRIGGAFGGKESRTNTLTVPMAVAAFKLKKPIRSMLDRDEDMQMTGGRHPILARWKVGFDKAGKIICLQVYSYANSGCTVDLTVGVTTRFTNTFGNCYSIPNARIVTYGCRTNLPSNTAFRGFGAPQAQFVMEDIIANVASFLSTNSHEVRYLNLINRGDIFISGQRDDDCSVRRCWDEVLIQSDFHNRLGMTKEFNRINKFRKRGISAAPAKFSLSFGKVLLNQAGALVNIYTDGSVLLSHAGVEMGQGLYTKMIQVAARALNIPICMISTMETTTHTVPNASPTAASVSADLNGMAILNACNELNTRLEPYRKEYPESWKNAVQAAYEDRICLFAEGFHKVPDITNFNYDSGKGAPFAYFSSGAAVTEVEIDCLTGHHKVLQTDIVMDVGNSINPAIDIGQIEGAFVQGMGLFTIEELVYSPAGVMLTKGPGSYKIPSILDIPKKFNVSLLRDCPNLKAVHSSRGVGEPPLLLATTVFFAIRQAIEETRKDNKIGRFDSPATVERIRLACHDWITEQVPSPPPGSYKPWGIGI